MTRKDAIKYLSHKVAYYKTFDDNFADAVRIEALEMALRALTQPEIIRCENCRYYDGEHCDMHNGGTYPTDYCSYAVWKYEEDES